MSDFECAVEPEVEFNDFWYDYEDDLQLAAVLGKTLLERNKELESVLLQLQQTDEEKDLEIDHLTKQLQHVRGLADSRASVYEQLDASLQEMDKANKELAHQSKLSAEKIKRLNSTIDSVEVRCRELQNDNDNLREREQLRKKKVREHCQMELPRMKRYYSFDNGFHFDQYPLKEKNEVESLVLQQAVKNLREQLQKERNVRGDLEVEVVTTRDEKHNLQRQVESLQSHIKTLESFEGCVRELASKVSEDIHHVCRTNSIKQRYRLAFEHRIENDFEDDSNENIPAGDCQVFELDNGSNVYGAVTSDPPSDGSLSPAQPTPTKSCNASLLSHLDKQYQLLIQKYKVLTDKHKLMKSLAVVTPPVISAEQAEIRRQTSNTISSLAAAAGLRRPVRQDEEGFTDPSDASEPPPDEYRLTRRNSPPEYKKLFKDIYRTLRRSKSIEKVAELDSAGSEGD